MSIAVLFDLDGTIVDSEAVAVEVFQTSYDAYVGGQAPVEQFLAMAGRPFEQIIDELGLPAEMAADFRSRSMAQAHRVRIFPGMWDVLTACRDLGASLGIITGKDRPRAEYLMASLGITQLCQHLVTPSDPPRPKPAPDGVRWLQTRLGAVAEDTILIGDSASDILAATSAGVRAVACLWGAGQRCDLLAVRPDHVVADCADLGRLLKEFIEGRTLASRSGSDLSAD